VAANNVAGTGGRALWVLAAAVSSRSAWRLEGATFAAEWTVEGWRVGVLVSVFFGDDNPRGPATVFGIHVKPVTVGPRWRARLARSVWHRTLLAELGDRYRTTLPGHPPRDQVSSMGILRTADLRAVLSELDRVATAIGGVATQTAAPTGRGRPTLFSVCRSIASSAGPWRLTSFSYVRRVRSRRAGTTWTIWKSLGANTSYELPGRGRGPGVLSMLGVSPADWSPETRHGARPPFPRTERKLLRAGYQPMHKDDDRAATFIHMTPGLTRRLALRELDRLESASLS
jgi:hypothetical protein